MLDTPLAGSRPGRQAQLPLQPRPPAATSACVRLELVVRDSGPAAVFAFRLPYAAAQPFLLGRRRRPPATAVGKELGLLSLA